MRVRIIGAPDSGNRTIAKIVEALLPDADTKIQHYPKDRWNMAQNQDDWSDIRWILIIRSQPFWAAAIARQPDRLGVINREFGARGIDYRTIHALMLCSAAQLMPLVLTYEALVSHPDAVTAAICAYLEVAVQPCPVRVFDANAQYLPKPPEDAVRTEQPKAQGITPRAFKADNAFGRPG